MAISEKILKAPPSTAAAIDPRDHFGTVLYTGTGTTQSVNGGKYDAAGSFNGSSSYIDTNTTFTPTLMTFSAWVYPTSISHGSWYARNIISNRNGNTGGYNGIDFGVVTGTGKLYTRFSDGSNQGSTSSNTVALSSDTWTHLAFTVNTSAGEAKVYKAGSLLYTVTIGTGSQIATGNDFFIGRYWHTQEYYWNGMLDQIRFYDSVLSASEISDLASESYADSFKINFPTGKTAKALYRLNGNANDETGVYDGAATSMTWKYGVNFTPDIVWLKKRNGSKDHQLQDTSRGIGGLGGAKQIYPNGNWAESTNADANYFASFDSGGFTLGGNDYTNGSGETYAAWCWKVNGGTTASNSDGDITSTVQVNDDAGISIVLYTTNGSNSARVGHGLATTPKAVLIKKRSETGSWHFMTTAIDGSFDDFILDSTSAKSDSSLTAPTSTTFAAESGSTGTTMVAYCFHDVDSYQKIGSYTGNGSTNGPMVETGFEPAFVLIKTSANVNGGWGIHDNQRDPSNPRTRFIQAQSSGAESNDNTVQIMFYSDGFQVNTTHADWNGNGNVYIYLAIAAPPETTTPVLAKSFKVSTYTGNGTSQVIDSVGFKPDMVWVKPRSQTGHHSLFDVIRGTSMVLTPNQTGAEIDRTSNSAGITSFNSDGFAVNDPGGAAEDYYVNQNSVTYVAWSWKASGSTDILTAGSLDSLASINDDAGFSIVKYTGNATAGATIAHGLSAAPEFMLIKNLDRAGYGWLVYHAGIGATKYLVMNTDDREATQTSIFNDTAPTSTVFTLGSDTFGNYNGDRYIAYCWRPITGYSKFGTYTGQTAGVTVTTGFEPDFLMIKASQGSYDEHWAILDSVRGSGKVVNPNRDNAESDSTLNTFTTSSTGFSFPHQDTADAMLNENGVTYIYAAFKMN